MILEERMVPLSEGVSKLSVVEEDIDEPSGVRADEILVEAERQVVQVVVQQLSSGGIPSSSEKCGGVLEDSSHLLVAVSAGTSGYVHIAGEQVLGLVRDTSLSPVHQTVSEGNEDALEGVKGFVVCGESLVSEVREGIDGRIAEIFEDKKLKTSLASVLLIPRVTPKKRELHIIEALKRSQLYLQFYIGEPILNSLSLEIFCFCTFKNSVSHGFTSFKFSLQRNTVSVNFSIWGIEK